MKDDGHQVMTKAHLAKNWKWNWIKELFSHGRLGVPMKLTNKMPPIG